MKSFFMIWKRSVIAPSLKKMENINVLIVEVKLRKVRYRVQKIRVNWNLFGELDGDLKMGPREQDFEYAEKHNLLCDDWCEYLSIKELEQRKHPDKPDHICLKYNTRVKHGPFHPKLMRCEECLKNAK